MRHSYYGINAFIILAFHTIVLTLNLLGVFPYFRTFFYPIFLLMPLMLGIVGWFEKDRKKWVSILAVLVSTALLTHWIIMLIIRLNP